MKVWITKYALTKGIIEKEVRDCGDGMVATIEKCSSYFHREGDNWHKTRESAVKKAEEMRKKKIESLKKRIAKLEKMIFE